MDCGTFICFKLYKPYASAVLQIWPMALCQAFLCLHAVFIPHVRVLRLPSPYVYYEALAARCAQVDRWRGASPERIPHGSGEVMAVQTVSALLAGLSSATLTNGLDVVKTRLQVGRHVPQVPLIFDHVWACGKLRQVGSPLAWHLPMPGQVP